MRSKSTTLTPLSRKKEVSGGALNILIARKSLGLTVRFTMNQDSSRDLPLHPSGRYGSGSYHKTSEAREAARDIPLLPLKDYLLIIREHFWWFAASLLLIFSATLLYTLNTTPLYKSSVRLHILRQQDSTTGFQNLVNDPRILNTEDFRTQVDIIKSLNILHRVFKRLNHEEREQFVEPYQGQYSIGGSKSPIEILQRNRKVSSSRSSLIGKATARSDPLRRHQSPTP